MSQSEYTYKLIKGGDNNLYVSIQPLMNDINNSIVKLCHIDTSKFSEQDRQIFDLKLMGLKTVYEFLGAFVTEQLLKDKQQELSGNVPLNVDKSLLMDISDHVKH